jgi:photosystem II stability/assembly factor-like uncharacterized protein
VREEQEDPGARARWERLRLQDENGQIPPNALINAYEQRKAMPFRPEAWGEFLGASTTMEGIEPETAGIQPSIWTWIGPGNIGGRIRSIIIHPTTPNTMWVGSVGGGVWKTTNGGMSWSTTTDFMANLAVNCMAIDPTNPNVLYAGTGEGFFPGDGIQGNGIFKTTNAGSTWTQLAFTANNSDFYWVNRLAISPTNNRVFLAATEAGFFRSTDGGGHWSQRLMTNGRDVLFHPTDETKCLAADASGHAYYSTDGGVTWTVVNGFPQGAGRIELAYARSNPAIVYAQVQAPNVDGQLFQSTDGGQTYVLRNSTCCGGGYANALWVDPTNANTVVAGGVVLWRSTNGAVDFTQIDVGLHADYHAIVNHPNYNGTTNRVVFVGQDGGIYKTEDVLTASTYADFTSLNHNLGVTQFYGAAGNHTSGTIIGGNQDNGTVRYRPQDGINGWIEPYGGDGGFCAADQTDPNYFYGEYVGLQIYRSTDGGDSVQSIDTGLDRDNANFIAPFVLDPNNPNTLLAGAASLSRSANVKAATPTWASIKSPISGLIPISAIAVAPGNSNIVWVGYNNGDIYYTTNGTAGNPSWTQVNGILPRRFCARITIAPQNPNLVYAVFGGFYDYNPNSVWRTLNNGATWTNISNGLPSAPVNSLVVSPSNSSTLYIGTAVGIFASADGGMTWSPSNDGPANVFVEELFWVGTQLVAATHGRGMFTAVPGQPAVTTNPATYITSFSATLNGTVNPNGQTTNVHFEYGTTTNYGSTTASHSYTGNTTQSVTANISGLTASTTYHFRIVATNNAGTVHGSDRTFTTLSATGPPVVITNPATYIASYSAKLNGSVDPHGLATTVYFQYGTTTSYGSATGVYLFVGDTYLNASAGITGLSANTTYHFRIVAINSSGTRYGSDRTFATLSATGPPVAITNPATNVASSSATLNGSVDPHGLTTSVHFQYGTTTSYGHTTVNQTKTGNTYQNVAANIGGLTAHTTYHFRIVATNSGGIRYGSDRTFRTTP